MVPNEWHPHTADLVIPARIIQQYREIDLGFEDLPQTEEELIALSLRIDAAFNTLRQRVRELVIRERGEMPPQVEALVMTNLAIDFVERYGILALFSKAMLGVFWEVQRPKCPEGPKRLRQVGEKLAIHAMAAKGFRPKKKIDIGFRLFKSDFVAELERLSRALGNSDRDVVCADQLLDLVRTGDYPMLKMNLRQLEEFLCSKHANPNLQGKNANAAELLARYGRGRLLQERLKPTMTPDKFFYTWMGWITNKRPSTVRREIQTAETRFKRNLEKLFRVTENR